MWVFFTPFGQKGKHTRLFYTPHQSLGGLGRALVLPLAMWQHTWLPHVSLVPPSSSLVATSSCPKPKTFSLYIFCGVENHSRLTPPSATMARATREKQGRCHRASSSSSFSLSPHPVPSSGMFLLHGITCCQRELGVQMTA